MPGVDEETALSPSPASPHLESSLVEDDRGTKSLSNHSTTTQQQQAMSNHIPATRGSIRLSDAGQNKKKKAPPKLLHP